MPAEQARQDGENAMQHCADASAASSTMPRTERIVGKWARRVLQQSEVCSLQPLKELRGTYAPPREEPRPRVRVRNQLRT